LNTSKKILTNQRVFTNKVLLIFNDEKKAEFLKLYKLTPNVGKIARKLGINRTTAFYHLKRDPLFKEALDEIREEHLDDVEEYMFERSHEKSGFMDRIALLRAYRGGKYQNKQGPSVVINNSNQNKDTIDKLFKTIPQDTKDKAIEIDKVP